MRALQDPLHVGVAPRRSLPWPTGFRRRFGIVHDEVLDLFEVGNVDMVVGAIRGAALAAAKR